jgi:hypothetical protein
MMKGTPCSSRRRATLKTLWKTHYLARSSNPAKRVRAWAQVGRERANIAKSGFRPNATHAAAIYYVRFTSTPAVR